MPSITDVIQRTRLDLRAASFYADRGSRHLARLADYARAAKKEEPDWLTSDSATARDIRAIEALSPATTKPFLTALDVATRLGCINGGGKIRDSFYNNVAPKIGYRIGKQWRFRPDLVDAYERGENP